MLKLSKHNKHNTKIVSNVEMQTAFALFETIRSLALKTKLCITWLSGNIMKKQ